MYSVSWGQLTSVRSLRSWAGSLCPRAQNQHLRKVTLRQEREESQWNQVTARSASWDFPVKIVRWTKVWVFTFPLTPAGQWGHPQEWGWGNNRGLPTSLSWLANPSLKSLPSLSNSIFNTWNSFKLQIHVVQSTVTPKTCHAGLGIILNWRSFFKTRRKKILHPPPAKKAGASEVTTKDTLDAHQPRGGVGRMCNDSCLKNPPFSWVSPSIYISSICHSSGSKVPFLCVVPLLQIYCSSVKK